jgi:hypothetical protein
MMKTLFLVFLIVALNASVNDSGTKGYKENLERAEDILMVPPRLPVPNHLEIYRGALMNGLDKRPPYMWLTNQPAYTTTNSLEISALIDILRRHPENEKLAQDAKVTAMSPGTTYHFIFFFNEENIYLHYRILRFRDASPPLCSIEPQELARPVWFSQTMVDWLRERVKPLPEEIGPPTK